eukprot:9142918-Lingulodinium_polyedra.AAC.1
MPPPGAAGAEAYVATQPRQGKKQPHARLVSEETMSLGHAAVPAAGTGGAVAAPPDAAPPPQRGH